MPPVPRRKQTTVPIKAVLCVLLCAACVLSVYLLFGRDEPSAGSADTSSPPPTSAPTAEPSPEPTAPPVELGETADAGQEYIDKMCFLGDSITYQMGSNHFLPFTQIWVPEVGTLALFSCPSVLINYYPKDDPDNPRELSIADTAAACQPEYLVITLGLNGIATLDEPQFKQYYRDLIHTIQDNSPDTKIICQSIFPVVESLVPEGITNSEVVAGNQWIRDVAEETGVRFLNTYEALVDSSGGLVPAYSPWDGYHVTAEAYEVIFQYIRTHAWQ